MKKNKGFTLIELLAIIVILAIIAVITVPIILNIIDNSSKGAAKDSAYGFKDSVNKWYVSKLQEDSNYKLNGNYTISNGKLNNIEIPLSGTKPSSGSLHYTNNILDGGCLTIGEYKVTFDTNGNPSSTEKGVCSTVPTIASCPGCKFIYTTTDAYAIVGSLRADIFYTDMPTAQDGLTDDYTTLDKNYFLGLIESTTNPGKIGRAFACGIEGTTPFCLEGYDASKWSDDTNPGVLREIFVEDCSTVSVSDSSARCYGASAYPSAYDDGNVYVNGNGGYCLVADKGEVVCYDVDPTGK